MILVMKKLLIPAVLVLAFLACLVVYLLRTDKRGDGLDEVSTALKPFRDQLPAGTRVGLLPYSRKPEISAWTVYAMQPVQVYPQDQRPQDTVLSVMDKDQADSLLRTAAHLQIAWWTTRSEHFVFIVTVPLPNNTDAAQ